MSISTPDNWRPTDHGFPEDFVPPAGVRYLVHGNVLTILDDRPGDKTPRPLTEEQKEQIRKFRRRLGLPEDDPPLSPPSPPAG